MATRNEVLRNLRFRDDFTTRDAGIILDYVDQEVAAGGGGFATPATENLDMAGFNIVGADLIRAVDGADLSLDGGDPSSTTTRGGDVLVEGGQGGADGGRGGNLRFDAGDGGFGTSTGTGGNILMFAGLSGRGSGANGGKVQISAGDCSTFSGQGVGGEMDLSAGSGRGTGDGGDLLLTPGRGLDSGADGTVRIRNAFGATVGQWDNNSTAAETRMLVYDVDNATLERVSVGIADSGGAGFKVLRIPN